MAITRVRFNAAGDVGAQTSLALPLGATATAGHVLLAVWAVDKSAGTFTTPSGWTLLASQVGTSVSIMVCGKVAAGTETTVTGSWSTAALSGSSGVIAEYAGADTSSPFGPSNLPTYSDTARTSMTLDPAAATSAGAAIAFFGIDSVDLASAGNTGFQPAATGFTWVTTSFDNLSGTANSGAAGAALVENLSITSGQDIAPAFSWTRSDQVAGFIQLLNTTTGTTLAGVTATAAASAPAGTFAADTNLAGPVATAAASAPAGSLVVSSSFAGPVATADAAAPAGSISTGIALDGVEATATASAPAGGLVLWQIPHVQVGADLTGGHGQAVLVESSPDAVLAFDGSSYATLLAADGDAFISTT